MHEMKLEITTGLFFLHDPIPIQTFIGDGWQSQLAVLRRQMLIA
jgi:hypothetical protein